MYDRNPQQYEVKCRTEKNLLQDWPRNAFLEMYARNALIARQVQRRSRKTRKENVGLKQTDPARKKCILFAIPTIL